MASGYVEESNTAHDIKLAEDAEAIQHTQQFLDRRVEILLANEKTERLSLDKFRVKNRKELDNLYATEGTNEEAMRKYREELDRSREQKLAHGTNRKELRKKLRREKKKKKDGKHRKDGKHEKRHSKSKKHGHDKHGADHRKRASDSDTDDSSDSDDSEDSRDGEKTDGDKSSKPGSAGGAHHSPSGDTTRKSRGSRSRSRSTDKTRRPSHERGGTDDGQRDVRRSRSRDKSRDRSGHHSSHSRHSPSGRSHHGRTSRSTSRSRSRDRRRSRSRSRDHSRNHGSHGHVK